jgi:hypothetical protein
MAKFNTSATKPAGGRSPITAEATPTLSTFEGGAGYARDAKSELFLLAVSNMVGEDTFYEKATDRDARYTQLVQTVAVQDPEWTTQFLIWLRTAANMRSASLVGALDAAKALVAAGIPGSRQIVAAVLQRADEPGEALAYWTTTYGRAVPKAVKRGIADAVGRLYTEFGLLKYDTASKGFRFGDVLDLVHPSPVTPGQGDLFKYALDRRHGNDPAWYELPDGLVMLRANGELRDRSPNDWQVLLDRSDAADLLRTGGMTWEDILSLLGSQVDKAKLWKALIPSMGYMALLRNLRNLDEAGLPDEAADQVAARLGDPRQVARSRQFPYRFLAAYEQAPSLRWGHALDKALNASLANLPTLPGRSLILVDTSASMTSAGFSARSKMTPAKAAAVFGVAHAARGEADLYGFADGVFRHHVPAGGSVIREVDRFVARTGEVGHGTNMVGSVQATFKRHDRVFLISDMQTISGPYGAGVADVVPRTVPVYGFNLGGYRPGAIDAGATNRHEFGGLTDATFRMVPLLESGRAGVWPWLAE